MADVVQAVNWVKVACALAAGICMGIGALGPSLGQGYIGGKACEKGLAFAPRFPQNPRARRAEDAAVAQG